MADFTTADDDGVITSAAMHVQGRKRIHLKLTSDDQKKVRTKADIVITSSAPKVVTAHATALFSGPDHIYTVDLHALAAAGDPATLTAKIGSAGVAMLEVTVDPKIVLPDIHTEKGMLIRLFLAESFTPDQSQYDPATSQLGMQYMKRVLENRLANDPKQFGAPKAKTVMDIVKAPNQIQGFSGYPNVGHEQHARLVIVMNTVNSDNDPRQAAFSDFLQFALDTADDPTVPDPTEPGFFLSHWMSGGANPGGKAIPFGAPISGNQFFKSPQ